MTNEVIVVQVRNGHATLEQPYVYCWFHPRDSQVMYVGATWMHPVARTELHLHSRDPQARIVGEHFAHVGVDPDEPIQILAFPVPDHLQRSEAKMALIAALTQECLLSNHYFGSHVESPPQLHTLPVGAWVAPVVATIRDRHTGHAA